MRVHFVHTSIAATLILGLFSACDYYPPKDHVIFVMVDVTEPNKQADANLLTFPNGERFLIDAGYAGAKILPYLTQHHVTVLNKVILTHMHPDHYQGLRALLAAGIQVTDLYLNLPSHSLCETEVPWGCDETDIRDFTKLIQSTGVPMHPIHSGDIFYDKAGVRLDTLAAATDEVSPIGQLGDVNEMSVVMSLSIGKTRAILTGDLDRGMGGYLAADNNISLEADILKVPHHGGEPLAPNGFFDRIHPSVALVPAPKWLWEDDRTKRVREYVKAHGTTTYVSALDGDVTLELYADHFNIRSAKWWRRLF